MNAAVRAVVRAAVTKGCTVFCAMEGYRGIVFDDMHEMDFDDVRGNTTALTVRCRVPLH